MNRRAQKARRILEVQEQLHRIEDWRTADLRRKLAELEESQRALICALNEDEALHGLFLDSMARRLRLLAEESAQTAREKEAQENRLLEQGQRLKCAERLSTTADRQATRASTRKELLEIAEQFIVRASQGSRKFAG